MKNTQIIIRVSEKTRKLIKEKSETLEISMSKYLLRLIEKDLKKQLD